MSPQSHCPKLPKSSLTLKVGQSHSLLTSGNKTPFQTKQGNRPSCLDQEGRRGSEEAVPGPSVFPSREPCVSGDFWVQGVLWCISYLINIFVKSSTCSPSGGVEVHLRGTMPGDPHRSMSAGLLSQWKSHVRTWGLLGDGGGCWFTHSPNFNISLNMPFFQVLSQWQDEHADMRIC